MSGTRRNPGPLGPYVAGYRARLLELGYAPLSATHSLAALGHLGRWMDREGLDADQLNGGVMKAFLAAHVKEHGHLPSAGVMPLLDYLRSAGVVAPEPTRRRSPLDGFLGEYREWLAVERALSPDTVSGYTRLARRFLAERVSADDELGVERLTGADVTGFLLRESARVKPGSVCCHANQLRQLVRYLSMRGFADPGLAEAVPSSEHAPTRPIGPPGVRSVVRDACRRADIEHVAAHRLRHALASELLREGASLIDISQVLRHKHLESTVIYAKVDLARLRQAAGSWPGAAR
jgi:hypothetical protein